METQTTHELGWHELANAPTLPGLYAWYLNPELRPGDLADRSQTVTNVIQLAEQLRIPTLTVTADGHLSLQLSGNLQHDHIGIEVNEKISDLVDRVLLPESSRRLFARILLAARPCLMAPLYIGVATSLRERLAQHRKAIDAPAGKIDESPYPHAHSFANEIHRRRIVPRRLYVHIVPIPTICDPSVPEEEQREVAEAVETVLNRLFYPILGRR